jgi:hypothetical protein
LHDKFALSGGIPNVLLSFGKPEEVRDFVRRVLTEVAREGGYILDAGAIMQDDTRVENLRALTEAGREFGGYDSPGYQVTPPEQTLGPQPTAEDLQRPGLARPAFTRKPPGTCLPWDEKLRELPPITGDPDLIRRVWEQTDALGYTFIWQCLLSF